MPTAAAEERAPTAGREWSLDVLRVVAVLGVIAIHVFAAVVTNDAVRGGATWWVAVVVDLGFIWVVPAFVMVSGALILDPRMQEAGAGDFYRRRVLRLGPAIVFWPLFYVLVVRILVSGQDLGPGGIAAGFLQGQPYTHLYFLWLIVGLYVVAPVLAAFLSQGGRRRALVFAAVALGASVLAYSTSGVLAYIGQPRPIALNAFTQWIPYVGYFLAGWALRGVVLRARGMLLAAACAALSLAVVIVQYGFAPGMPLLQALAPVGYLSPFTATATVSIYLLVRSLLTGWSPSPRGRRVVRALSDAAFGVFLVHFAVIVGLRTALPGIVGPIESTIAGAAGMWLVVAVVSFGLTLIARRIPFVRRLF